MGYVFISYSRWDRKSNSVVDKFIAALRDMGIELWLAPDSIAPGTDFNLAIDQGLARASAVIVLWGSRAEKARGMAGERAYALQHNTPLFVVMLDGDLELPPELAEQEPYLISADFERQTAALVAALPAEVKRASPTSRQRGDKVPLTKGYVFISYAYQDGEFVSKLRSFLKERGYGFWDYQDSDRNYHMQLFLELENVIRGASATISVLSPAWKESKWAAKEYIFSEEVGTPVFLLMARPMGPTLVTAGIAYIDFTRDEEAGFAKLDRELRRKGLI